MERPQSSHTFSSPSKAKARPQSNGEPKPDMWSSLLDSVAIGKRLPEKTIILFGGSPETQKDFLEVLASDSPKRPQERHRKRPPIANEFALGYTYQDVLDADQEDILARVSIYTLLEPSLSFAPLLTPLLTARTVPETLLVILLDWAEPWKWVRQIRDWMKLCREVWPTLEDDARLVMGEIMQEWEQRRRGGGAYESGSMGAPGTENNVTIPLGPGEWDEGLGLPLCVVCHNSDKIDLLEKQQGWKEEDFDYVLQFLRTILLKHGASLIYTSNSMPNSLPPLIQSTLGIHSLLKRQPLKHNVIDRDKIFIPPNWDSWGKIRVLREGFDVEGVSDGWSTAIQPSPKPKDADEMDHVSQTEDESGGPVAIYEQMIHNPEGGNEISPNLAENGLEIKSEAMQEFLARQLESMEKLKAEEEKSSELGQERPERSYARLDSDGVEEHGRVNDHIGPVQFNMGGIQVDAEDMLKRLKDRERAETPDREAPQRPVTPDGGKKQNEVLASFFAGLMKRGAGGDSPRPNN